MSEQKIVGEQMIAKIKEKVEAKVDTTTFEQTIGDITTILESL